MMGIINFRSILSLSTVSLHLIQYDTGTKCIWTLWALTRVAVFSRDRGSEGALQANKCNLGLVQYS